jgi:hypothetical protein
VYFPLTSDKIQAAPPGSPPASRRRRNHSLDHDQIIVLALEAGAEKSAAPVRSNRPSIWSLLRCIGAAGLIRTPASERAHEILSRARAQQTAFRRENFPIGGKRRPGQDRRLQAQGDLGRGTGFASYTVSLLNLKILRDLNLTLHGALALAAVLQDARPWSRKRRCKRRRRVPAGTRGHQAARTWARRERCQRLLFRSRFALQRPEKTAASSCVSARPWGSGLVRDRF